MTNDIDESEEFDGPPSKSQIKRELDALKDLGARLLDIPDDQLAKVSEPKLIDAVQACRKITRGSARRRQVQYIGKLLRDEALSAEVNEILDRLDSGSRAHAQAFHRLEVWRDGLINQDADVMQEICDDYPDADRQHLRQLARKAADEKASESTRPPVNYRKLFQYLRTLTEAED